MEEKGIPLPLKWNNKCKLETVSFGHGVSITPLQAVATYSSLVNGGNLIKPTILKKKIIPKMKKLFHLIQVKKSIKFYVKLFLQIMEQLV